MKNKMKTIVLERSFKKSNSFDIILLYLFNFFIYVIVSLLFYNKFGKQLLSGWFLKYQIKECNPL